MECVFFAAATSRCHDLGTPQCWRNTYGLNLRWPRRGMLCRRTTSQRHMAAPRNTDHGIPGEADATITMARPRHPGDRHRHTMVANIATRTTSRWASPPASLTQTRTRDKDNHMPAHANALPHPPATNNNTNLGAVAHRLEEAWSSNKTKASGIVSTRTHNVEPRRNWRARRYLPTARKTSARGVRPACLTIVVRHGAPSRPTAPRGLRIWHFRREPTSSSACP